MVRKAIACLLFQLVVYAYPVTLLLDWWPNPHHIPLYYGIEQGIFLRCGIELTLRKNSEAPNVPTFVATKNVSAALYYMPQAMRASEKLPVQMLCSYVNKPLQGVLVRSDVSTLQTVAGFPGAFYDQITDTLRTHIHKIPMESGLTEALFFKHVDGVFGVYPTIEGKQLKALGIETEFMSAQDLGIPPFAELVILTHKEANRALMHNLQQAITLSIDAAKRNPKKAFEIYLKRNPDKTPFARRWERDAWEETVDSLDSSFNREDVRVFHQWMKEKKLLRPTSKLEACFFDFAPDQVKENLQ